MSTTEFDRVAALVIELRQLDDAGRNKKLDDLAAKNAPLAEEVRSLLKYSQTDSSFLEGSALTSYSAGAIVDSATTDTTVSLPDQIGPYRILERLGIGGMGTVYRAQQERPRRQVALKVMHQHLVSVQMRHRFTTEAEVLGRLQHPGVAQIFDANTVDVGEGAQPYFVMELIEGTTLTKYAAEQKLRSRDRLSLFVRICHAIEHAHQKGVVHRDLKPENILVDKQGQPKVLDFGIARATDNDLQVTTMLTRAGQIIGTIPYMSPEQLSGNIEAVDTRTDIYALGVVLFELLSDRLPHDLRHQSIPEAARIVRDDEHTRLMSINTEFRGDIDTIVNKAIEKEPARRYQSVQELAADVQRHLDDVPITARPASSLYQLRKFTRRNRTLVTGLVATMLAIIIGATAAILFALYGLDQKELAEQKAAESDWNNYRLSVEMGYSRHKAGNQNGAFDALDRAPGIHKNWEWDFVYNNLDVLYPRVSDGRSATLPDIAFRSDGSCVTAISFRQQIQIYNLDTESILVELQSSANVCSICLNSAGTHVIGMQDGKLVTWNAISGDQLQKIDNPGYVPDELSRDGTLMLARRGKNNFCIVDLKNGDVLCDITGNFDRDFAQFSHKGDRVLVCDAEKPEYRVRIIDVATGQVIRERTLDGWSPTRNPQWNPSDTLITISAQDLHALVLDSNSLKTIHTFKSPELELYERRGSTVGFLDDTTLINVLADSSVEIVDLVTGTRTKCLPALDGPVMVRIRGDTNPPRFAMAGIGWVGLHVLANSIISNKLVEHTDYVYCAAWSPDGTMLATAAWDQTIRFWDGYSGAYLGAYSTASDVDSGLIPAGLQFTDNGATLEYIQNTNNWIDEPILRQEFNLITGERREEFIDDWRDYLPAAPPGMCLEGRDAIKSMNHVLAGDYRTKSPDGRFIAYWSEDKTRIDSCPSGAHAFDIVSKDELVVAFSNDGEMLATGTDSGVVQLHSTSDGNRLDVSFATGKPILNLSFNPDNTRLLVSGFHGTTIYDVATLEPLIQIDDHQEYVRTATFSPDGTRVATASGDHSVGLWDARPHTVRHASIVSAKTIQNELTVMIDKRLKQGDSPMQIWHTMKDNQALSQHHRNAARYVLIQNALSHSASTRSK